MIVKSVMKEIRDREQRGEIDSARRELRHLEAEYLNLQVRIRTTRSFLEDAGELTQRQGVIIDRTLALPHRGPRKRPEAPREAQADRDPAEISAQLAALSDDDRRFCDVLRAAEPRGLKPEEILERLNDVAHPAINDENPKKTVMAILAGLIAGRYAYRTGPGLYRMRQAFR